MLTLALTLTATLDSDIDWMKRRKKFKNIIMVDRDLNLHPLPHFNCTLTFALQWLAGNYLEKWEIYSRMLTLMLTLTLTLTESGYGIYIYIWHWHQHWLYPLYIIRFDIDVNIDNDGGFHCVDKDYTADRVLYDTVWLLPPR